MYDAKLPENSVKQAEKDLIRCSCVCDIGYFSSSYRNVKLFNTRSYYVPTEGILCIK